MKKRIFTLLVSVGAMLVLSSGMCSHDEEPDVLSVSPTALIFGANDTQQQSVEVTTNVDFWEYAASSDWIIVQKAENNLFVSVKEYTSTNTSGLRTGSITVRAGDATPVEITVTQNPKNLLGVNQLTVTYEADETGDKTVNVTTNVATWNASFEGSSNPSWVRLSKNNNDLNVTVSEKNSSSTPRSVTVKVTAGSADPVTFTVTQKGAFIPYIEVLSTSISASYTAQTVSFNITSNISWTVSRGSYTWITASPASGSNNATVSVALTANTSSSTRTGTITVSGSGITRNITITQSGQPIPQSPQVRFNKTSNNKNTYEMAVVSASLDLLAYYQFKTSIGTTSYFTIQAGNHYLMWNEGGDVYMTTTTYNFQSNRKYTFEYDGSGYYMISDGTYNTAPQEPVKIPVTFKRMENMTEIPKPLK